MTKKHAAQPIVVGVDGSDEAVSAARWAAGLAVWHRQPVHLVHAMSSVDEALLIAMSGRQDDDAGEYPRALGQAVLDRAAEAIHADFPTLQVSRTLSHRSAKEALIEQSRRARMVVVACTDVSAGGALLVGSTTLALATHAACPVVAWRGRAIAPNDRPVVVGIDEERISSGAMAEAFELADCLGVGLTAVYAMSALRAAGEVDIPILIDWEALQEEARQRLVDIVAPVAARWPNVRVSHVVEVGRASQVIVSHAVEAQLVVVGSRGHGGLASVLLGSTGLGLLHHSPVPVVICPAAPVSVQAGARSDQPHSTAAGVG